MKAPSARSRRGFTLIELLTVIAIIGILAAILIPTVGKVRENAKRAQCTSNVRQITALLINWANQDKLQRFPNIGPTGSLPWDVLRTRVPATPPMQLTLDDLAQGAGRDVMYCPSGMKFDNDELYTTYDYATIDYILLVGEPSKGPAGIRENPALPNMFHSDRIRAEYTTTDMNVGGKIVVPPSARELVVDALAVSGTKWDWTTQNLKKRSNHISGAIAAGVNVGFVDGHVSWRSVSKLQEMSGSSTPKARTATIQNAYFVW